MTEPAVVEPPALAPYIDVEVAIMDLLDEWYGVNNGTATPADLQQILPFVRVTLVTGRDDGVTDYSVVDIDVYTATRQQGYDLAEDIRARLLDAPHRAGTVVIDKVRTETKPFQADWEDQNVRRRIATYRFSARR